MSRSVHIRANVVPRWVSADSKQLGFFVVFTLVPPDPQAKPSEASLKSAQEFFKSWPGRIESLFRQTPAHTPRIISSEHAAFGKGTRAEFLRMIDPAVTGVTKTAFTMAAPPDCGSGKPNKFEELAEVAPFWSDLVAPALPNLAKRAETSKLKSGSLDRELDSFEANPDSASDLRARNRIESPDRRETEQYVDSLELEHLYLPQTPGWEKVANERFKEMGSRNSARLNVLTQAAIQKDYDEKQLLTTDELSKVIPLLAAAKAPAAAGKTAQARRLIESSRNGNSHARDLAKDPKASTDPEASIETLFARLHQHPSLARQFRMSVWCICDNPWKDKTTGWLAVDFSSFSEEGVFFPPVCTVFEYQPPSSAISGKPAEPGWFRPYDEEAACFDEGNLWRKYHLFPNKLWNVTQEDSTLGSVRALAEAQTPAEGDTATRIREAALPATEGYSIYATPLDTTGDSDISVAEDLVRRLKRSSGTGKRLMALALAREQMSVRLVGLNNLLQEDAFKTLSGYLTEAFGPEDPKSPKAKTAQEEKDAINTARNFLREKEFDMKAEILREKLKASRLLSDAAASGKIFLHAPDLMRGYTIEVGKSIDGKDQGDWRSLCWRQVQLRVGTRLFPRNGRALIEEGFVSTAATVQRDPLVGKVTGLADAPKDAELKSLGAGLQSLKVNLMSLQQASQGTMQSKSDTFIVIPGTKDGKAVDANNPPTILHGAFRPRVKDEDLMVNDHVHLIDSPLLNADGKMMDGEKIAREVRIFPVFSNVAAAEAPRPLEAIKDEQGIQVLSAVCTYRGKGEVFPLALIKGYSGYLDEKGSTLAHPKEAKPPIETYITEADRRHFTLGGGPDDLVHTADYPELQTADEGLPVTVGSLPGAVLSSLHLRPGTDHIDKIVLPFVEGGPLATWLGSGDARMHLVRGEVTGVWMEIQGKLIAIPPKNSPIQLQGFDQGHEPQNMVILYEGKDNKEREVKLEENRYYRFIARRKLAADGKTWIWGTSDLEDLTPRPSDGKGDGTAEHPELTKFLEKSPFKKAGLNLRLPDGNTTAIGFEPVPKDGLPRLGRFVAPWALLPGEIVEVIGTPGPPLFRARALPQHPFGTLRMNENGEVQSFSFADTTVARFEAFKPNLNSKYHSGFWKMKAAKRAGFVKIEPDSPELVKRRLFAEVVSLEELTKRDVDPKTGKLGVPVPTGYHLISLRAIHGDGTWRLRVYKTDRFKEKNAALPARRAIDLEPGDCIVVTAEYDDKEGCFQPTVEAVKDGVNMLELRCGLFGRLRANDSATEALVLGSNAYWSATVDTPGGQRRDVVVYSGGDPGIHSAATSRRVTAIAASPVMLVRNLIAQFPDGSVQTTETPAPPTQQLTVSDNIARWRGWSLAVKMPGDPDEEKVAEKDPFNMEIITGMPDTKAGTSSWTKKLPPLRFQDEKRSDFRYLMRLRRTDLCGNLGLDQPIPDLAKDPEALKAYRAAPPYRRPDPPAPPALTRERPNDIPDLLIGAPSKERGDTEGKARLVIISDPVANPRGSAAASDRAYVVPPPIAPELAIQHGVVDAARNQYGTDAHTLVAWHDRSAFPPADSDQMARGWFDGMLAYTDRSLSNNHLRHSWNYFPDPQLPGLMISLADHEQVESTIEPQPLNFYVGKDAPPFLKWVPFSIQLTNLDGLAPAREPAELDVADESPIQKHTVKLRSAKVSLPAGRHGFVMLREPGKSGVAMQVEVIHAVTAPVLRPQWSPEVNQAQERDVNDTSVVVQAVVTLDAPSTGELRLIGWWNDHRDEGVMEEDLRPAKLAVIRDATSIDQSRIEILNPGAGYGTFGTIDFEDARYTRPEPVKFKEQRPVLEPFFKDGHLTSVVVRSAGKCDPAVPLRLHIRRCPPLSHFAVAEAVVSGGRITSVKVIQSGGWYLTPPFVVIHDTSPESDGYGAEIVAVLNDTGGIASFQVNEGGSGYSLNVVVGIYTNRADFGTVTVPMPSRATGTALVENGVITAVRMLQGGGPYSIPPAITIRGDGGTGAELRAELGPEGQVTAVTVISGGTGYPPVPVMEFENDFRHPLDFRFPVHMPFGDTRERTVYCEVVASSRHKQLVPDGTDRSRTSLPLAFHIRSTSRPSRPDVAALTYSYKWNLPEDERHLPAKLDGSLEIKRMVAVRVWLRRPVKGRLSLGVVVANAEVNTNVISGDMDRIIPPGMRNFVSRWGYDPARDPTSFPALRLDDFSNATGQIPYEDLPELDGDENRRKLGVAIHEVFYDDRSDRWYSDITIRRPRQGIPYVELRLVSVQEHAAVGCLISEVEACDMIPLSADRQVSVKRVSGNEFHFTVRGAFERPALIAGPDFPRRQFKVAFRRKHDSGPAYAEGPLANQSDALEEWQVEHFQSKDLLVLDAVESKHGIVESFEGRMQVEWPLHGEGFYFRIYEHENYATSEPQRGNLGEPSDSTFQTGYANWKPFTCAISCEPPDGDPVPGPDAPPDAK